MPAGPETGATPKERPLRVGVIGCGAIALNKHLPALLRNPETEVAALCGRRESSVQAAARLCEGPVFLCMDYRRLLERPEIDAVCVCLPNALHAPVSIAALNSGKHVLCEKPMAYTYEEAAAMQTAARQAGKTLSIAYQNRWRPDIQYAKALCRSGALGRIYHVDAVYLRRRALPNWGGFREGGSQAGGALLDLGSHILDLALWLTDDYTPRVLLGKTHRLLLRRGSDCNRWGPWNTGSGLEDSAFAQVLTEKGMDLSIRVSWAANVPFEERMLLRLLGTEAGLEWTPEGLQVIREQYGRIVVSSPVAETVRPAGKYTPSAQNETDADREWRQFASDIRAGNGGNAGQALVVSKVMQGIYDASKQNGPVFLDGEQGAISEEKEVDKFL